MARSTAQDYEERGRKKKYDKEYWLFYTKEKFDESIGMPSKEEMKSEFRSSLAHLQSDIKSGKMTPSRRY